MGLLPEPAQLALFLTSSWILLVLPGPAVFYIVARSVSQGRSAGLVSTLGVAAGGLVHVFAAAAGLSALMLSSANLFALVKILGAAYLVYLGIRSLFLTREIVDTETSLPVTSHAIIFREALVVNILNPKTALFFLAFLPQFVDPYRGDATLQFVLLGGIFCFMGLLSDGLYALGAGGLTRRFGHSSRSVRLRNRVAALTYFSLGMFTLTVSSDAQT